MKTVLTNRSNSKKQWTAGKYPTNFLFKNETKRIVSKQLIGIVSFFIGQFHSCAVNKNYSCDENKIIHFPGEQLLERRFQLSN